MSLLDEPVDIYIKYLDLADEVHNKGLHLDKTVEQLAEMIYNQRDKQQTSRER